MKKQAFAVAVGLLFALAASVCHAQRPVLSVNVPFAFQVGDKALPAGDYQVQSMTAGDGQCVSIRQKDGGALTIVSTMALDSRNARPEPELVFHQYGNSYFLSQIWTGAAQGRQLLESEREKEVARSEVTANVALLAHPSSLTR